MVDVAEIKIWGKLIGAVRWDHTRQLASFQYDQNFLSLGWELSPMMMPLKNGNRIYEFPELKRRKDDVVDTFKGLPGLLADILPDRYGNQLINIWLAKNGRPTDSMNPVEQLCFIGTRGMGALEFEPAQPKATNTGKSLEIESLVAMARKMLSNRDTFHTTIANREEENAVKEILKIGTSAGGARPKAVIAYHNTTGDVKSGQNNVPKGYEHWLIKLDGVSDAQFGESRGYGKVEYAYYLMAMACGLDMMPSKLLEEGSRAHFMTKRFDREANNVKHHIQTFCGIQHNNYNDLYSHSYEQLYQTMRQLRLTYPEAEQMFRRMVFNVLATNCDDHTKNFSFRMKKGEKWTLSPAYDICYSYDPTNEWVNQQSLSINGKHRNIDKSDLMTIAKANSIKKGEKIIEEINQTVKNWTDFAKTAGVSDSHQKRIEENLHVLD